MKLDLVLAHFDNVEWAMPEKRIQAMFHACVNATREDFEPEFRAAYQPAINHETYTEIKADGPIVRRASFFAEFFGALPMERLADDLIAAEKRGFPILMRFGTPGGEAIGMNEMADVIAGLKVPVIGYVGAEALSAGFLLYSQTTQKVAHPGGLVGSVGVRVTTVDEDESRAPTVTVSENAPNKDSVDVQSLANSIESEMLNQIARGFGITPGNVIENFGQGDVLTARQGIKQGMVESLQSNPRNIVFTSTPSSEPQAAAEIEMKLNADQQAQIDAVGGIEKVLALAAQANTSETDDNETSTDDESEATVETEEAPSDLPKTQAELDARIAAGAVAAVTAEQSRIRAIKAMPGAAKLPKLAARLIENGTSAEDAKEYFADSADIESTDDEQTSLDAQHAHDDYLNALEEGNDATASGGEGADPKADAQRIADLSAQMKSGGLRVVNGGTK